MGNIGIMKKAYELSTLTGTQVLLLVVSETGLVYTFTTAKLQPLVTQPEGKNLIQACLNAPHGALPSSMPVGAPLGRSAPQSAIPPAPPQNPTQQPLPGQAPPHLQQVATQQQQQQVLGRAPNVPGGLAIGGGKDEDHDDRHHDDVDAEGDKRGASRRRTSASGAQSKAGAGGPANARSPTNQHAPQLAIPGGQPNPAAAAAAAAAAVAAGAGGAGGPMAALGVPGGGSYSPSAGNEIGRAHV